MQVRVCNETCAVTSVTNTAVTCVAPSSLLHASGTQTLVLTDAALTDAPPYAPPPPPSLPPDAPSPFPPPISPPPPASPPNALEIYGAEMQGVWGGKVAANCIDGRTNELCHSGTSTQEKINPYLTIELMEPSIVDSVEVWNWHHQSWNLGHYQIWVGSKAAEFTAPSVLCFDGYWNQPDSRLHRKHACGGLRGTHVTVVLPGSGRILKLAEVGVFGSVGLPPQELAGYAPPPPMSDVGVLELTTASPMQLLFSELTPTNLPLGAVLGAVALHVTPRSGRGGALVAAVRAALVCQDVTAGGVDDVEWDVQPYDLGFSSDQSPNLAPLLAEVSLCCTVHADTRTCMQTHAHACKCAC